MKTLKAKEGMVLVSQDGKTAGKILYLPDNSIAEFKEITDAEYKQMLLAQQEKKRVAVINRLTHKIHSL